MATNCFIFRWVCIATGNAKLQCLRKDQKWMDLERMNNPPEQVIFKSCFFQWLGLLPRNLLCLSCLDMIIMIRFCDVLRVEHILCYNCNRLILVWGLWMTDKKPLTKNKRTFRSIQRQKFVGVGWLVFRSCPVLYINKNWLTWWLNWLLVFEHAHSIWTIQLNFQLPEE